MKRLNLLAVALWLAIGIYGIFYNITYIDEAKYLIKGWLITTGQVGYYSTPEFFYQHMPGGLLWYGLGQKLFGPSLLVARFQSFFIGLLIIYFTYRLAKPIKPQAGKLILPVLALSPVAILYYSSAVPQSLAALTLILGFYNLFKNKNYWATFWFTMAFIVRENFLFTLILYLIYQRHRRLKQLALSLLVIAAFVIPGWPGITNVFKNFPGISWLLPVSGNEKEILSLSFQQQTHSFSLYLTAAKEFIAIFFSWLIIMALAARQPWPKIKHWNFLVAVFCFNFLAHAWSAFNLSPRAIVPYFAYIAPLASVIASAWLVKTRLKLFWLFPAAATGLIFASLWQPPGKINTITAMNRAAAEINTLAENKTRTIWIAEPITLYLNGKVSYYPLINHTNFYKPSNDTATIKALGFWNQTLLDQWLKEADLLVLDPNRLALAKIELKPELEANWEKITPPATVWPPGLEFYLPKSQATTFPDASPSE